MALFENAVGITYKEWLKLAEKRSTPKLRRAWWQCERPEEYK